MDLWSKATLKSLVIPGGILLLATTVLLHGLPVISAPALDFYYYAAFAAGTMLAWRFSSSRVLFALVTVFLAHRSIAFFSAGRTVSVGPGRIAFEAVAFLLPVNFVAFSLIRERGLTFPAILSRVALLFFESVLVAVLCRPGEATSPRFLGHGALGPLTGMSLLPPAALLAFSIAFGVLLIRFLLYRKPVESGLLWSLAATFLAFEAGGVGKIAGAYLGTAGLVLASSLIENSYLLAYHDELTSLPARRAFNEALLRLERPYAVAVVDIDHFKNFNDTYGHETGDQVLRMVAARLAGVTGSGQAFRVGGEEFCILFPEKSVPEALPDLERLRAAVAGSTFRVRGGDERRSDYRAAPKRTSSSRIRPDRGSADRRTGDRRTADRRSAGQSTAARRRTNLPTAGREVAVTVSIGVAEPNANAREVEQVIQSADKALYRAKQAGRNRVETATPLRARTSRVTKHGVA